MAAKSPKQAVDTTQPENSNTAAPLPQLVDIEDAIADDLLDAIDIKTGSSWDRSPRKF